MDNASYKEPTLKEFKEYLVANVVAEIVQIDRKTFKEATKEFLQSETYKIIKDAGTEYDEVGPDYFYDMWHNEVTIGRPVTSDTLEVEKLKAEGKL